MKKTSDVFNVGSVAGGGTVRSSVRSSLFVLSLVLAFGASAPLAFATTVPVSDQAGLIAAVATASSGNIIVLADGRYTLSSTLEINTPLTLQGTSEAGTIIDTSGVGSYGIHTQQSNVVIKNLTVHGNSSAGSGRYAIKIEGKTANSPLNTQNGTKSIDITLDHVTVQGSYSTGIDLNGVTNSTISNVTVNNTAHGTGIGLTDSDNITLTNIITSSNAWGGIAVFVKGSFYPGGSDGITVNGTNSFGESLPLVGFRTEIDNSAYHVTNVHVQASDFPYYASLPTNSNWFTNAYTANRNDAVTVALSEPTNAYITSTTDGSLYVASGLLIQKAVNAAPSGAIVNVAAGAYPENVTIAKALTVNGPNVGIAGNGARGAEATVSQVNITASTTVVNGFSFVNPGVQMNINGGATKLSGVVLKNNIFSGYGSVGIPTFNAGNLLITRNLFKTPLASTESMQIKADGATSGGCNGTVVSDNVFMAATNNGGAEINFSCTGSGSTGVTVSGNTDTGLAGVDNPSFTAFSGVTGGIVVTNNNVTGTPTAGSAIWFWGGVTGSVNISDNVITGFGAGSGIDVGNSLDGNSTGAFTFTNNNLSNNLRSIRLRNAFNAGASVTANRNNVSGNTTAGIQNDSATLTVDATRNWWGDATGPSGFGLGSGDAVSANVTFNPWFIDAAMTTTNVVSASPASVDLLSVLTNNFVILSETGITDTGSHSSVITGNIGLSPTSAAAIGVWCVPEMTGDIYGVNAAYAPTAYTGSTACFKGLSADKTLVDNAVKDMGTAYANVAKRPALTSNTNLYGGNLGGRNFAPGLYKWTTDVTIPTDVTLSGSATDVWIFQISGNLSIASAKEVKLSGGAQASNVFWQVGGGAGATLGTDSTFNGTILSATQVVMQTRAVLNGRALAQTLVTLDANAVTVSTPAAPVLITITVSPAAPSIVAGNTQTFTASGLDQYNAAFATTTTWTSSNPSIATINSTTGLATGISAGMVTITASSTGSLVFGTTTLTVTSAPPPPPSPGNSGGGQSATPAVPANVATPEGCLAGDKFSTTTGRNCNAATPATPSTNSNGNANGRVLGAEVFNFLVDFGIGSRITDVTELQKILLAGGHLNIAAPTGYFGALSLAAVKSYQKAHGVIQTGYVGPLTRGELNKGSLSTSTGSKLNTSQASAVVGFIQAFGADADIIANVKAALGF